MNLTDDAMQVSLRITAWSGRLYDRQPRGGRVGPRGMSRSMLKS